MFGKNVIRRIKQLGETFFGIKKSKRSGVLFISVGLTRGCCMQKQIVFRRKKKLICFISSLCNAYWNFHSLEIFTAYKAVILNRSTPQTIFRERSNKGHPVELLRHLILIQKIFLSSLFCLLHSTDFQIHSPQYVYLNYTLLYIFFYCTHCKRLIEINKKKIEAIYHKKTKFSFHLKSMEKKSQISKKVILQTPT